MLLRICLRSFAYLVKEVLFDNFITLNWIYPSVEDWTFQTAYVRWFAFSIPYRLAVKMVLHEWERSKSLSFVQSDLFFQPYAIHH